MCIRDRSETVWRQANEYKVPRMVYVNKMDTMGADFFRCIQTVSYTHLDVYKRQIPESFRVMLKELQSLGLDVVVQDKEGNEIDMRQNFDDEETGFDMRDVAGTETVANENELLNDYTIKDADAGFDDPSVLEDDSSAAAEPASDEVNIDE